MSEFTLTIKTDNAAFGEHPADEIGRLLARAGQKVWDGELDGRLLDVNGNHVGDYSHSQTAEEDAGDRTAEGHKIIRVECDVNATVTEHWLVQVPEDFDLDEYLTEHDVTDLFTSDNDVGATVISVKDAEVCNEENRRYSSHEEL